MDKNSAQQGYLTSEPFAIQKAGVKANTLMFSDQGFPAYATTISCMDKTVKERSKAVQAFVTASMEGWKSYLADPAPANALIKKDNPEMTDEQIAFSIAKMKDGVIILNNSRGQMVVEQDLADALNSGKVAFAGLDVVSTEPIRADNPLLTVKNCIITPHISWAAQASRQRIMDITVDNIKAFLDGNTVNRVNK